MERTDVAVIGAGLCGAAVAHELTIHGFDTLVIERADQPAAGASRGNSGILHTGFDSTPGTLETQLIRSQSERWQPLFDALGIPYRRCGALLLAQNASEAAAFPGILARAADNGVDVTELSQREVRESESLANAYAALHISGEAITDPFEVVQRLLGNVQVRYEHDVLAVHEHENGARIDVRGTSVVARAVINCAGLFGDEIADDGTFAIVPRRGEFVVYPATAPPPVRHILLPLPTARTKGVLVFPTLYGNVCAGPSAEDQVDKDDWQPRADTVRAIRARAETIVPALATLAPVSAWCGLRPSGVPDSYVLRWSPRVPAMFTVGAIRSTGLSACLGIARYVREQLRDRGITPRGHSMTAVPQTFAAPVPWWERLNRARKIGPPC